MIHKYSVLWEDHSEKPDKKSFKCQILNICTMAISLCSLFTGVLEERYVREVLNGNYFSDITEEMNTTWKKDHGKSVKESLNEYLVENVGKPMSELLR